MTTFSKEQRELITEQLRRHYIDCVCSEDPADTTMATAWYQLERLFSCHNMQDDRNHGIDPYTGEAIK